MVNQRWNDKDGDVWASLDDDNEELECLTDVTRKGTIGLVRSKSSLEVSYGPLEMIQSVKLESGDPVGAGNPQRVTRESSLRKELGYPPPVDPGPVGSFVTKDSGERIEFDSGMRRDTNEGKTLWHLVASGPMLKRWAELLTRGAAKYDENNWMKAEGEVELKRFKESAFRHFMQWFLGDSDEDHAAAIMFNINGAEYVREKMAAGKAVAA